MLVIQILGLALSLPMTLSDAPVCEEAVAHGRIQFLGRTIDVAEHLRGFPFDSWRWAGSVRKRRLAYLYHSGGKVHVATLDVDPEAMPANLYRPSTVMPRDWSDNLTFFWTVLDRDGSVYFMADQNNNERFNVYEMSPDTGEVRQRTDVAYVAGFSFSPDESKLAYTERMGKEGSRFRLRVLELDSGRDTVVAEDTPQDHFTWGNISWQPQGKGLALTALWQGDRNRGNIAYVPLSGDYPKSPRLLTDTDIPRTFPEALKHWFNDEELLFTSPEQGVRNVCRLNVRTGQQTPVTNMTSDVMFAEITRVGDRRLLVVTSCGPLTSAIMAYDLSQTESPPVMLLRTPHAIDVLGVAGEELWYRRTSATEPVSIESLSLTHASPASQTVAGLPHDALMTLIHGTAEAVLFPTFDDIQLSLGEEEHRGQIHGVLYRPRNPLPPEKAILMVRAFYGGENAYCVKVQILLDAGVHVFSPAPRGSTLFDARFEQANDADMGGREALDVIYGAQFASRELDIPPHRVGAYGGSHGGYASLRLLTFAGHTNEHEATFPWGFCIAEAAFASIRTAYGTSNIKGWFIKEAGDPSKPGILEQWERRAPLNNLAHLHGRVLLIHGTNDERIPFSESQAFFQAAVAAGKGQLVQFMPIEGAGHSIVREADHIAAWRERLKFLETLPK